MIWPRNRPLRIVIVLTLGMLASAAISALVYQQVLRPAQAREEAFAAIQERSLAPGPGGVVTLPARWAAASVDGKAYVTGSPAATLWALFARDVRGQQFSGRLFCNKPNKTAAKGVVDLDSTPAGKAGTVRVTRALSPFGYEVESYK